MGYNIKEWGVERQRTYIEAWEIGIGTPMENMRHKQFKTFIKRTESFRNKTAFPNNNDNVK